jgi:prefoldin subunit 1
VQKRLKDESEALTKDMSNLDKKEDYLEKTYTNSKNSLEQGQAPTTNNIDVLLTF